MFWLIWVILVALVVGVMARALLPGKDEIGCGGSIVIGWLGSFVGGFLGSLIGDGSIFRVRRSGIIGSIIGAVVLLLIYRLTSRRGRNTGDHQT